MTFSPPTLHPSIDLEGVDVEHLLQRVADEREATLARFTEAVEDAGVLSVPLTTVSKNTSFDAYITIGILFSNAQAVLVVDSGNAALIHPRWEDIAALPPAITPYTVLGTATEPWGCPCNIVQGPIVLTTLAGTELVIQDCIFYACTGDGPNGGRTANFGAGCLAPWSASGWNRVDGLTLQAPLSYLTDYPYAQFTYAPAAAIFSEDRSLKVSATSLLTLTTQEPSGFTMFAVLENLAWMAVAPQALAIGGVLTTWPGNGSGAIAMIDTGGTCAYLSDPAGYVYSQTWPDPVQNPSWTSSSTNCQSTSDAIDIILGDGQSSFALAIDPATMPASVQGLTLVMCERNAYMMGQYGMNVGGISALFATFMIDYGQARVGFRAIALAERDLLD